MIGLATNSPNRRRTTKNADDRNLQPTATDIELRDAVGDLSERAIRQPWHPQTSNGALLFLRYGGFWGRLAASEVEDELVHIGALAQRCGRWPILDGSSGEVAITTTSTARCSTVGGFWSRAGWQRPTTV